jgi:hypothetical protein
MNHSPLCPSCGFNRRDKRHIAQQRQCANKNRLKGKTPKEVRTNV